MLKSSSPRSTLKASIWIAAESIGGNGGWTPQLIRTYFIISASGFVTSLPVLEEYVFIISTKCSCSSLQCLYSAEKTAGLERQHISKPRVSQCSADRVCCSVTEIQLKQPSLIQESLILGKMGYAVDKMNMDHLGFWTSVYHETSFPCLIWVKLLSYFQTYLSVLMPPSYTSFF